MPLPRARLGAAVMALAAITLTVTPALAQEAEPTTVEQSAEPKPGGDTGHSETTEPSENTRDGENTQNSAAADALEHTVAFAEPSYRTGDAVVVKLTLRNSGDTPITVSAFAFDDEPGDITIDWASWRELAGAGLTIAPGATHRQDVRGWAGDPGATTARFRGLFFVDGAGVSFSAEVPVEVVHGGLRGVVYRDRNGNRQVDAGEPAAGEAVSLRSRAGGTRTTTTDGSGAFAFTGLAPVAHYLSVTRRGGWEFEFQTVQIVAGEDAEATVPGVRPFEDTLDATMRFTEDSYQPGDVARIDITLTNTGDVPLAGIRAYCNRSGEGPQLDTGSGWGELLHSSAGVRLAAGETKRITVTETVPERVRDFGVVTVHCDFGFEGSSNPAAQDWARVPGTRGSVTTVLFHDRDRDDQVDAGEQVGGVDVHLTDRGTGAVVESRRAGPDGSADFTDIATGLYGVDVTGPWAVVDGQPGVGVKAGGCWYTCDFTIKVVPGADEPPTTGPGTPPAPTSAPAPAPRPAPPGSLPDTGADVRWLFGLGLLTVLAGAGLLLVRRKRA